MITVSIIGSGNVAHHLARTVERSDKVLLKEIAVRPGAEVSKDFLSKLRIGYDNLSPVDVCIIAVADAAIAEVSDKLPIEGQLVVHTSGSVEIDALSTKNRRGVFYPLQTFSKMREVDFRTIPICLEVEEEHDRMLLQNLADALSEKVYWLDSADRKPLHAAAVFASNFSNHMYAIADKICCEHNLPFEIMLPLIRETAAKLESLHPQQAQTGPAIRNDVPTIESHLNILKEDQHIHDLYNTLTQSIQRYGQKL